MRWTRWAGWVNIVTGIALGVVFVPLGMAALGAILLVSLAGSGAFMVWLAAGWDKPLEDVADLHKYGRPANATVMAVEEAQLTGDGGRTAKLKLRVAPVNESEFTTKRRVELPGGRVPAVGETVTVKFDPRSRKNVVLLEQTFQVEDHVSAARRNIATMGQSFPTAPQGPGTG